LDIKEFQKVYDMVPSLKIIIFEGSFTTTTFINRLVKGLSKNHKVYILGFNNSIEEKIANVKYIDLGSSQNYISLVMRSKVSSIYYFLKTGNIIPFLRTIKNSLLLHKKELQQDNFNRTVKLINPDIVHVQWQSLLPWCEEILNKGNYKTILSQRGYQSNVRPFVVRENFKYLQKWYPKFSGFHSVSKAISNVGDQIYSSENKIDQVVYSGFNFSEISFNTDYTMLKPIQILSVGRSHWIKGYTDAISACALLKQKGIEFNYSIVGASLDNEELIYLINDLDLQKNITLIPKMTQQEVYEVMRLSNVLLFPSLMEGLPNVIAEAMAVGLPVISTKCGGVEELIENNKTGWLVPIRDPGALANAIIDSIETPEAKMEEMRLEARKKVEEQHAIEEMVSGMEALYCEVLKE
tara:strand:+ start:4922 stop:6148 length:1227 start_codon:yes stop_codon:yes gene_type:complete